MARQQPNHLQSSAGLVRGCVRAPGKFEVVNQDGSVDPYAYRTAAEAQAVLDSRAKAPKPDPDPDPAHDSGDLSEATRRDRQTRAVAHEPNDLPKATDE